MSVTPDINGWMPIETALKDGREVLLHVGNGRIYPSVMAARWYQATDEMGWWDCRTHFFDDADVMHWMPLPAPPVQS